MMRQGKPRILHKRSRTKTKTSKIQGKVQEPQRSISPIKPTIEEAAKYQKQWEEEERQGRDFWMRLW